MTNMTQTELINFIYDSAIAFNIIDLSDNPHLDFLLANFEGFTKQTQAYLLTFTNLFELTQAQFPASLIHSSNELHNDLSFYFIQYCLKTTKSVSNHIIDLFSYDYSTKQSEFNQKYVDQNLNLTEMNCENLIQLHSLIDIYQAFKKNYYKTAHNMIELMTHPKREHIINVVSPHVKAHWMNTIWITAYFFHIDNSIFDKKEDLLLFLKLSFDNKNPNPYALITHFEIHMKDGLKKRIQDFDNLSSMLSSRTSLEFYEQKVQTFLSLIEKHKMDYYLDEIQQPVNQKKQKI
jgi:hypothetical protein